MSAIFHVVATVHYDIQFYCTLALFNVLTSCAIFCRKHLFYIHDTCSENLVHVTILLNILYNAVKTSTVEKYVHKHEFQFLPLFTFMSVELPLRIWQCFVKS